MDNIKLAKVKLPALQDMMESMEEFCAAKALDYNQCEAIFEFLVDSFYPTVYDNIMSAIKDSYTRGYVEGINVLAKELAAEYED